MKRKIVLGLLSVVVIISSIAATPYQGEVQNKTGELTIEDVVINEQLQDEIDTYLNSKLDLSVTTMSVRAINLSEVEQNQISRAEGFQKLEERCSSEFTNVEIDSEVREILEQSEDELTLQVYEWTTISYLASEDAETEDVMGYGIDHEMTFAKENGTYELVYDSFDERLITGVCSSDYAALENEVEPEIVTPNEMIRADVESAAVMSTRAAYNVNAAINYANQYCGITTKNYSDDDGESVSGNNTSAYNSAYTYYIGADCANFVSQCLYAGGLQQDSTWKVGIYAWINAKGLVNYLTAYKGFPSYDVSSNGANIYPGNPVYWINSNSSSASGHQMICTGYNSKGEPVLNGHNSDMFRVPYDIIMENMSSQGYTLQTIHIVSSDQHQHESTSGTLYSQNLHSITCNHCRKAATVSHTFTYYCNASSHWQSCTACGYTKTPTSHTYTYSKDNTYHWQQCSLCGYSQSKEKHSWKQISGPVHQCTTCSYMTALTTYSVLGDNILEEEIIYMDEGEINEEME